MIQADQFTPSISVRVFKTIDRLSVSAGVPVSQRYTELGTTPDTLTQGGQIDLTPFLGDQGGVRTTKGINDPAGGFTVTLTDQEFGVTLDSIYSALEPMDLVEIRMSRPPLAGQQAPVVMRGFISEVTRDEGISDDGRPSRTVVISGQDYGKIWQLIQVLPLAERLLEPGRQLYQLRVLERFGVGVETTITIQEFVSQLVAGALSDALAEIIPETLASRMPRSVVPEVITPELRISVPGIASVNSGTLYELIRNFADVGVFNELFLEDREEGVACVLRPYPAINLSTGDFIQPIEDGGAQFADVRVAEIKSMRVTRSDANVANFFYTESSAFDLTRVAQLKIFQVLEEANTLDFRAYANSSNKLYGDREMRADVRTWPAEVRQGTSGQTKEQLQSDEALFRDHLRERRRVLSEQNKDNVVLESGSMRLGGRPDIKPGMYLNIERGGIRYRVYCTRVDHEYVPFSSFTTTVQFERGTGFAERIRSTKNIYNTERI